MAEHTIVSIRAPRRAAPMIEFFLPPDQPVGVFLNLVIAAIAAVGIVQVVHTSVNDVRTTLKDLEKPRTKWAAGPLRCAADPCRKGQTHWPRSTPSGSPQETSA